MSDQCQKTFNATDSWYEDADRYWKSVSSNVDGMLGGLEEVHGPDVRDSAAFLAKLLVDGEGKARSRRHACDCGAGIGRVTKHLLLKQFEMVDMVEQNREFLDSAAQSYLKEEKASGRVGEMFAVGLQEFTPSKERYDVIWCQWVLSHLTDDDMVEFLLRCVKGLAPGGLICVKENVASQGYVVDSEDSSVTRAESIFTRIFERANLKAIKKQAQTGFPAGLFKVKMWALQPDPEIKQAYDEVRDVKEEGSAWFLLTFAGGKKLQVSQKGAGGIEELKQHLKDDGVAFGYIRFILKNDEQSSREKFVLVSWIGDKVGVMSKAKFSIHKVDVIKVLKHYTIEVPASDVDDIKEDNIVTMLKKAGGANYDRQTSDY
ncbi:N-terminal Xaa-Pro-Lys N-methyltransferase 1 [Coemansia sp. RSA 552]|nr:N-terminal Xaa-Pro-Lys N-methyltransferase 1 [Coemansia sp. RSA 552]